MNRSSLSEPARRRPTGQPAASPPINIALLVAAAVWGIAAGLTVYLNRDLSIESILPALLFFSVLNALAVGLRFYAPSPYLPNAFFPAWITLALSLGTQPAMIGIVFSGLLIAVIMVISTRPDVRSVLTGLSYRRKAHDALWNSAVGLVSLLPAARPLNLAYLDVAAGAVTLHTFGLFLQGLLISLSLTAILDTIWLVLLGTPLQKYARSQWQTILITNLLMLFAPLLGLSFYSWQSLRLVMFVIFSGGILLLHGFTWMIYSQRQRLAEFQMLSSIEQALSSALELNTLLNVIRAEIGKLFDTSGMYLALYNEQTNRISFPIMYIAGEKVDFPSRPFNASGLTEYITRTRLPLIFDRYPTRQANELGLGPIGEEPKSYIGFPVVFGPHILGVFALRNFEEAYSYRQHDIQLLETITSQIGIALHNATLYTRGKQLSADIASLNRVSGLFSASLIEEGALGTICRLGADVMETTRAAIFLRHDNESGYIYLAASTGLSEIYQAYSRQVSLDAFRGGAARTGELFIIEDIYQFMEELPDEAIAEAFRSLIEVPLRLGDRLLGAFTTYYDFPRKFEPREVSLMETLGAQIAVAVENVRLFEAMHSRSQELEALYQASSTINASLSLKNVLQAFAESMLGLLNTDSCVIYLAGEDRFLLTGGIRMVRDRAGKIVEEALRTPALSLNDHPRLAESARQQTPILVKKEDTPSMSRCQIALALAIPLVSHGQLIGLMITGSRDAERVFKPEESRLAMALANQAAVTIQNARLFERTDTALEKRLGELAAIKNIAQRMTRRLDLATVINQVAEAAQLASEAEFGDVALVDQQTSTFYSFTRRNGDGSANEIVERWPISSGLTGRALRTRQPVLVSDVRSDDDYLLRREDVRSELVIPILLDDYPLGVINLESSQPDAFTQDHVSFVSNLAEFAAIAIENARLFESLQRHIDELSALRTVAVEMLQAPDLEQLLSLIARETIGQFNAQDIHIYLYDQAADALTFGTSLWASGETGREFATPRPNGVTATVARSGERQIILNPATHELMADQFGKPGWDHVMISLPLKQAGRVVGVFNIAFKPGSPVDEQMIHFLEMLANQAAVAIVTAQLYQSERRQRSIAETLLEAGSSMASSLDLGHVLIALARHLLDTSRFQAATIVEWRQNERQIQSLACHARAIWPVGRGREYHLSADGVLARVMCTGSPELITTNSDSLGDEEAELFKTLVISSARVLPLRAGKETIGVALVATQASSPTTQDAQLALCEQFLAEAQTWLVDPLQNTPHRDLSALARRLSATGEDNMCLFLTGDPAEGLLRMAFWYSDRTWAPGQGPTYLVESRPQLRRVLEDGEQIIIHHNDDDLSPTCDEKMQQFDAKTLALLPLTHHKERIGLIQLFSVEEDYQVGQQDLNLWQAMADQATIAIANAQLAQQISDARDQLQATLDSSHDGILMFDNEARLIMANPRAAYLLNLHTDVYLGQHFRDILQDIRRKPGLQEMADPDEVNDLVHDINQNPRAITRRTYQINRPNPLILEETSLGVFGADDEVLGQVFTLRDVTQQYELETFRQELSDMIVHDLRSPLAGIISGLHLALDEVETIKTAQPAGDVIIPALEASFSSAEKLLALVETILLVSRMESGRMPLTFGPVNLADLARNTYQMLENIARESGIDVQITAPDDLPDITADREKIERVYINLLDNALQFAPTGGYVRVEITDEETFQRVSVIDNGEGIPAEKRSLIFDRFTQLKSTTRRRDHKGFGLGLTFCQLAVEAHNGQIWVDEGPEGGAAFRFILPKGLSASATGNDDSPTGADHPDNPPSKAKHNPER